MLKHVNVCGSFYFVGLFVMFLFSASSSVLLYRLVDNTQELGKIKAKEGESIDFDRYPVGTMLFIYPFHVSRTLAYFYHEPFCSCSPFL